MIPVKGIMNIRKADKDDLDQIIRIYEHIHDEEESGNVSIGWIRDVYPTKGTAEESLKRGDLFVLEENGRILAAAIINRIQVPEYRYAGWKHEAGEDEAMILHTLVVDPRQSARGYGKAFVFFYEDYAGRQGCHELRMDTNEVNIRARKMYQRLGYEEVGIVPCIFNGIPDVKLVCLEKYLG